MSKNKKIEKLNKHRISFNIGIAIFLFILLYVAITIIHYFSKSHLSIYEVQTASLAQNNIVTGLIIREEQIINAEYSGYINYYHSDCTRIAKGSSLFSIDETKDIYDTLMNSSIAAGLNEEDSDYMKKIISDYRVHSSLSSYILSSEFVNTAEAAVREISNNYTVDIVSQMVSSEIPDTFHFYISEDSGLISYYTDALCGITLNTVTGNEFKLADSYKEYQKRKNIVEEGNPVLKYITDNSWQILCQLNESQLKALKDKSSIDITICEDGLQLKVPFEIVIINSERYALLQMEDYIQNYLNERFLSVELLWQVSDGYKIPLTAITEKTFFVVPIEFFTLGGNSNHLGLVKEIIDQKTGAASYEFTECTIYHNDGMYYYIDPSEFSSGDVVYSNEGMYTINLTETLEGAYNINKGYAVFRRIERITQNDEYCIISKTTTYGLTLYDHIALNASDAVDSGIIY